MKHITRILATALIAIFSLSVWAHGGEDHGDEAAPTPSATVGPRAASATEVFELVAVLEGKKLMLTLDRFATNEPVTDAQIEVESGASKAVATQTAPGVYWVAGNAFTSPGKYPLTISVQAGDSADLLTTTLEVPAATIDAEHNTARNRWLVWSASAGLLLLLLLGVGIIAMRHRKKPAGIKGQIV